jgi:hypothetical protein
MQQKIWLVGGLMAVKLLKVQTLFGSANGERLLHLCGLRKKRTEKTFFSDPV